MSKVLFISDLHFGHKWMAIHRGFKDELHHDEHIINIWNKNVSKNDLVWILGDITMESNLFYPYLDRLKGRKKVVLGNHDKGANVKELLSYVDEVYGVTKYKGFLLSHVPLHPWEVNNTGFKQGWRGNIHGHLHEYNVPDKNYFNVSAEQLDYKPISFDDILRRLEKEVT